MTIDRTQLLYDRLIAKRCAGEYDPTRAITYSWDNPLPSILEEHMLIPQSTLAPNTFVQQMIQFRWLPKASGEPSDVATIGLMRIAESIMYPDIAIGSMVYYSIGPRESVAGTGAGSLAIRRDVFMTAPPSLLEAVATEEGASAIRDRMAGLEHPDYQRPEIDMFREPTALALILRNDAPFNTAA